MNMSFKCCVLINSNSTRKLGYLKKHERKGYFNEIMVLDMHGGGGGVGN